MTINNVETKLVYTLQKELQNNRHRYGDKKGTWFFPEIKVSRHDLHNIENIDLNQVQSHLDSKGLKHCKIDELNISRIKDHSYTSGDFWSFGDVLCAGPIGIPFLIPAGIMAFGDEALQKLKRWHRPEIHFNIKVRDEETYAKPYVKNKKSTLGGLVFSN